ncbi:hypothetical protein K8T06_05025 [bacterium]|nr:hypothetical protein [bacterium]
MTEKKPDNSGIKYRIKSFSDNMFRNYQIMRKRWEITSSEKKRATEISRLGNTVYRLFQDQKLLPDLKKIEPQIKKIEKIDLIIKNLEERLRDIIMRTDMPRQLSAGQPVKVSVKKTEGVKPAVETQVKKVPQEKDPARKSPITKGSAKKVPVAKEVKTSEPKIVKKMKVKKTVAKAPVKSVSSDQKTQAVRLVEKKKKTGKQE